MDNYVEEVLRQRPILLEFVFLKNVPISAKTAGVTEQEYGLLMLTASVGIVLTYLTCYF